MNNSRQNKEYKTNMIRKYTFTSSDWDSRSRLSTNHKKLPYLWLSTANKLVSNFRTSFCSQFSKTQNETCPSGSHFCHLDRTGKIRFCHLNLVNVSQIDPTKTLIFVPGVILVCYVKIKVPSSGFISFYDWTEWYVQSHVSELTLIAWQEVKHIQKQQTFPVLSDLLPYWVWSGACTPLTPVC